LGVFKVTLVTKVHKVTRFVHLTLETTEGRFDGFAFSDINLDVDRECRFGGYDWFGVGGREERLGLADRIVREVGFRKCGIRHQIQLQQNNFR